MTKSIYIHTNDTDVSKKTKELLEKKLDKSGYVLGKEVNEDTELIVCIGGDGSFLEAIHKFDFPHIPFIGINTGHLGFFQEIHPEQLDDFIFNYGQGRYTLQPLSTVKATVIAGDAKTELHALNEIVIKSDNSHSIHLNISIGGSFIERFSGDGILISSPAGSTGYNYSLGGSIVDPRLKLLQVTPIAPMNTTAYRSFTSSILLPPDMTIGISPEESRSGIVIAADSLEYKFDRISGVNVSLSATYVNLLRFESYDFWNKVKTKFL